MKQIIIGIHGLGNKPSSTLLKYWWLSSIKEGLNYIGKDRPIIPFELVYWADIFHEKPLDENVEDKSNPLYLDEPYTQGNPTLKRIDDSYVEKILQYIEQQLDKIFLNEDFSINFKNVTDKIIHHYFSELEAYFKDDSPSKIDANFSPKQRIQNRLTEVLKKYKDYEILLIAHSMGSIVAFDVLSSLSRDVSINTFVTIGSPLGLPVIGARIYLDQKSINPSLKKPFVPNSISEKWFNISDKMDKIALDHTLNDDFDANLIGVRAEDLFVFNNYEINENANHHKSYGYLRTPELALILDNFLKKTRRDRFYRKYKSIVKNIYHRLNVIKKVLTEK